jgi:hypothetical protein
VATTDVADGVAGTRGVATVTVEFDVTDAAQATRVAEHLFDDPEVLTVRVGGVGERSVYRVDVVGDRTAAEADAVGAATRAAARLGLSVRPIRVAVTRDGLGDPERTAPPDEQDLPWRQGR